MNDVMTSLCHVIRNDSSTSLIQYEMSLNGKPWPNRILTMLRVLYI